MKLLVDLNRVKDEPCHCGHLEREHVPGVGCAWSIESTGAHCGCTTYVSESTDVLRAVFLQWLALELQSDASAQAIDDTMDEDYRSRRWEEEPEPDHTDSNSPLDNR